MLDALRRRAGNWMAKILLVLLIIAFAVWGVADVFHGYGETTVAKVGKTSITTEQFQQAYQNEIDQMSRQVGRRLTPDQARMVGLDQRTLSRLIGSAALDSQIKSLGLAIPTSSIAANVTSNPGFAGMDGKYSKLAFETYLRQLGMSEQRYVAVRKQEDARELVTEAISAPVKMPKTMIDMMHKYREETRVIEFATIDANKVVKVADADEAKLKEYFEAQKQQFAQPEMRKLALLLLDRAAVKAKITISDDDIKATYETDKDKYNVPETRHIYQVAFADKAAADKAAPELQKATNFVDAAEKLGYKMMDIDLGTLEKKAMIDSKIADAAFALKKDEVSPPIAGQFSTVVLKVIELTPAKLRTLDDVKQQVRDGIVDTRISRELSTLHDKVEEERSAGKSLKDAAAKLGLDFREVAAVDRTGNGLDEKPAIAHSESARIVNAAFSGIVGAEQDSLDLGDGGSAWVDVLAITPTKERAYEDVKAKVKDAWLTAEKSKELSAAAARFVERLAKGEAMEAVVKEFDGKVEKVQSIKRDGRNEGLTANAIQQAFVLPKGGASSAPTQDGKSRVLIRVSDIVPAVEPTTAQVDVLQAEIARQSQGDAISSYVGGLQTRYGFTVNEAALRYALGLAPAAN